MPPIDDQILSSNGSFLTYLITVIHVLLVLLFDCSTVITEVVYFIEFVFSS